MFTFPDKAELVYGSDGWGYVLRQYRVIVLALPIAQGQGANEGYQSCLTLLQSFIDTYLADPTLGSAVTSALPESVTDTGWTVLKWFDGHEYHGFQFTLPTKEMWSES